MRDFLIINSGSVLIFRPETEAATVHALAHFPEDTLMYGGGYVVERRYAVDILIDLEDHGFELQEVSAQ